jgi:hypothetical protein
VGHRRQPVGAHVDRDAYLATMAPLRAMDPAVILSSHLPAAIDSTDSCLDMLRIAPDADAWVGPDQRALEQLLAGFEPGGDD